MKNARKKAIERFKKDEKTGIREYRHEIKKSSGKEKEVYKKILPDEKKHYKLLKKIQYEKEKYFNSNRM